jgi:protein Mpv17
VAIQPDRPRDDDTVLIKMVLDQLVWSPAFTCVFFAWLCLTTAELGVGETWPMIQDRLLPTMAANYLIWPLAHLVNFKYVPPSTRILYNMAVSVVWCALLSAIGNDPERVETLLNFFPDLPGLTGSV